MNRRRALRIFGTVLAAAGALVLIWVVIVWRWQEATGGTATLAGEQPFAAVAAERGVSN